MTDKSLARIAAGQPDAAWREFLTARGFAVAGGVAGALLASSCCILPLILFSLGISGAWIGNLTGLAPYQPYFLAVAAGCLGYGYWLVYRTRQRACTSRDACARPLPNRLVMFGLIAATALFAASVGFNVLAPLILQS